MSLIVYKSEDVKKIYFRSKNVSYSLISCLISKYITNTIIFFWVGDIVLCTYVTTWFAPSYYYMIEFISM